MAQLNAAEQVNPCNTISDPISSTFYTCLSCHSFDTSVAHLHLQQQEQKLQGYVKDVKQELRTEALGQLKDVTSFFVQQFKANKIAHAEVQTVTEPRKAEIATQVSQELSPEVPAATAANAQVRNCYI